MSIISEIVSPARRWFEQDRLRWIKILVISGILLFSVYFVPRIVTGNRRSLILLLLYLSFLGLLVLLRWPAIGLILTIMGGALIPFSGPSGLNVAFIGIALLLGLWLLEMIVRDRKIQLMASRTILPAIIFIVISIIVFVVGQIHWYPFASQAPIDAQIGGLAIFLLSLGTFILAAHILRDMRWLQALTWSFIALGGIYVIGRILGVGSIVDRFYQNGFTAGSMFWTWLVALTFSQAAFNHRLHWRIRVVLWGVLLITLYVAIVPAYDWKSGWIPPLAAIASILGFRYWRRLWILLPLAIIPANYIMTNAIATDRGSYGTRLDAWALVIRIVKVNPILGLGFANYRFYTHLFPYRGVFWTLNSHNQYVDIYAQTGLLGLACLIWLAWEFVRLGWSLRQRAPEGFAQAYVYGVLGGIVGMIISGFFVDWFLPFVYNIGMSGFRSSMLAWLFLGGLVSLEQIVRNKDVTLQGNGPVE